jgi:hypothetical protein
VYDLTKKSAFQYGNARQAQIAFLRVFKEEDQDLVFEFSEGVFKVSYNTIDALVEKSRVHRELYHKEGGLLKALEMQGWELTIHTTPLLEESKLQPINLSLERVLHQVTAKIFEAASEGHRVELDFTKHSRVEKEAYSLFNTYFHKCDTYRLAGLITQTFRSHQDKPTNKSGITKKLETLDKKLWFATLPKNNPLKRTITDELKPGQIYERGEVEQVINQAFGKIGKRSENWLRILRAIFLITNVKERPGAIRIVRYHLHSGWENGWGATYFHEVLLTHESKSSQPAA